MNTKQFLISSLIVVAGTVVTAPARADGGIAPTTRADVRAQVLEARAAGELRPAGDASEPMAYRFGPSMLARADVKADTVLARLHGELTPSGEGFGPVERQQRLVRYPGERMAAAPRR